MQNEKTAGTNCYNCTFISKKEDPVDIKDLNEPGGIDPKTQDEMERAKKADLITLPGGAKSDSTNKKFYCNENKDVRNGTHVLRILGQCWCPQTLEEINYN
jgi:hypothetical protein